jgi:autotransporter-associated beta strand protein
MLVSIHHSQFETQHKPMKRSIFAGRLKNTVLAIPACALMLGAAQAGTTIGLNFQAWYYDSGSNPQTIGFGFGYQTTGFPVTGRAFGVNPINWWNTDPLPAQAPISSGSTLFGSTASLSGGSNTFAGTLTLTATAPNAWQSGIGEQNDGFNAKPAAVAETVAPGNNQVTWGYLDDGNTTGQAPSATVSGLKAKFPNGYVIQTIAANSGAKSFINVDFTDSASFTNTAAYTVYQVASPDPNSDTPSGSVGLSASSGVLTNDIININPEPKTSGTRSVLCGFIVTDQPVVSQDPASGSYVFGQQINLSAGAIGIPPLSYQWRSNGIPVPGATSATYSTSVGSVGSYTFDVIVTNLYGATTSLVANATVAVSATLTWDADTLTAGAQDGSGNWDNGITANWWNGSADVAWGNLDSAVFGSGGTGTYAVTVTNNVTVNNLTFNSGNYTIAGSSGQTVTLAGTATIVANTNATISLPLAGSAGLTKSGSGALNLTANNTFGGNLTVNSGSVQGGTTAGGSYLGAVSGGRTIMVASGAAITVSNNNVFNGGGETAGGLPAVVINGGTFNSTRYNSIGNVTLNSGATLSQSASDSGSYLGYQFLGSITAGGSSASTISTGNGKGDHLLGGGVNIFNVADATSDANPDLIVSAPLVDGSGDYSGIGSIVKTGAGTLMLSAVNTYTGTTTVSNGTLAVSGQLTGNGAISLSDATALNVTPGVNAVINTSGLVLGSSGTSTNTLGFNTLNSTTVAPITAGPLTINNPVTVKISGAITTIGTYPLMQYAGESGAGTFILGALPSGVSATLVDDHSSLLSLNVTATPVQTELWTGSPNGNWDINNTANWLVGVTPSKWSEGNIASFDDSASGTTSVTLNVPVHPSLMTFNNSSKDYTLSGSGAIAGASSLTLNGSGKVTLSTSNSYSGGTFINAGTLSVGADTNLGTGNLTLNSGTLNLTGSTAFTSAKNVTLSGNGTIQVDNTAGAAFSPAITGSGAFTKSGNGTLTFAAQQTYTGGTTVNGGILDLTGGGGANGTIRGTATINTGGTLRLSTGDAVGYNGTSGALTVINLVGGTLNINSTANQTLGNGTINMTGGAITGLPGANLDFFGGISALNTFASSVPSTISGTQVSPLRQGGTTFDVQAGTTPSGIDLDISSVLRTSPAGDAALGVLVKADSGTMRLSAVNTYRGGTEVQGGTLILTGRLIGGGGVTVDDGATLNVSSGVKSAIVATNDLILGAGGALTLGFANVSSTSVPLVSVINVTVNDAVTVNISGKVGVGVFPLIKYSGTKTGSGSFTLGTLPAGVSATLVDNAGNQSLDLNVSSAPLSIITDISSGTNFVYAGANYTLSVVAGGNPTIGYQWYTNGGPIVGATAATLSLTRVTTGNSGSYYVIANNGSGSVASSTNHLVVLPVSGYADMAIATGPTAFWPLNESAGPIATDYMGGHNASYSSAGVIYGVAGPVGGNVVTVNGSSGQVSYPYSPDLNPSGAFTAEAWLNPSSVSSTLMCALSSAHIGSPRSGWLIYESTAGWELRTYNQNGTTVAVDITGGTPTVGVWNHVAVVWDGAKGYLYVNGVLKNSSVATNFVANPDSAFTIGSRSDSAFYWGGSVGDVAFYSRALTAPEIQAHAQNSPSLQITPAGGKVVISWVPSGGGTLLASPSVGGSYTNVPTATSPWTNAPAGTLFYRVGF